MNADAPPGCDAVLAALARLDAAPRVVARVEVVAGRPHDGIARVELRRDGGTERLVIDGRPLRGGTAAGPTSEALRLAPEGACERAADARSAEGATGAMATPGAAAPARVPGADAAGTSTWTYDAWAERDRARVALRVDARGRPLGADRDAPELAWGRALSRPTKPPQPMLRPTGGRLVERIEFDFPDRGDAATIPETRR